MRASGVPRERHFPHHQGRHEYLRADDFAKSVDESLAALEVDYVDLLLVHWPNPEIPLERNHAGAGQGQAAGTGAAHRRRQFQHRAARSGDQALPRAAGGAAGRVSSLSRPDQAARRGARSAAWRSSPIARSGAGGCSAIRCWPRSPRREGSSIAQIALRWLMQQGVAADSAVVESAAHRRQFQCVRFHAERRRDGAHRRAQAAERPHRQSGRAGVRRLGLGRQRRSSICWRAARRHISYEGLHRLDRLNRIGGEWVVVDEGVAFALQQHQVHDATAAAVGRGQPLRQLDRGPFIPRALEHQGRRKIQFLPALDGERRRRLEMGLVIAEKSRVNS